ncbi:MAG: four helix bundle protein [bacterium]
MQDYRKLSVWEKAHRLVVDLNKVTKNYPKEELFVLTSQIRRAAISIPSNIAEGCGRKSKTEFLRFLDIAFGSANELEYQIFLSFELEYISNESFENLNHRMDVIKKMLSGLMQKISKSI